MIDRYITKPRILEQLDERPACSLPFARRYSSKETTTSSRPCTMICCGPSVGALRTTSLKRALASCNAQRPSAGESEL